MERVVTPFQTQFANRYPLKINAMEEAQLKKFVNFFGKPGVIASFYNNYLTPFVDTSKKEWTWKQLNAEPLPLSPNVLRQIQQAMTIHPKQGKKNPFLALNLDRFTLDSQLTMTS